MLPMYLFATTFYPLSTYPGWLRPLIELLPLYQSIELVRGPALGSIGWHLLDRGRVPDRVRLGRALDRRAPARAHAAALTCSTQTRSGSQR